MTFSSFRWPERPTGLYRDPERGKIAGVCAGLGAYFEVRPKFIRLAMILGCVFGLFVPIVIGYILLTILLPTAAEMSTADPLFREERPHSASWTAASADERIDGLKVRFRALDQRLAAIEEQVTSEEFRLRQKFRDL